MPRNIGHPAPQFVFRVPSQRDRCARPFCTDRPIVDMYRVRGWYGYCRTHLMEYGFRRERQASGGWQVVYHEGLSRLMRLARVRSKA